MKRYTTPILLLAILLSMLPLTGCGQQEKTQVILVSIDTLRADHVTSYGYNRDTSPNLSRLIEESVYYTQAYANGCWTMPSHMSLLTGTLPSRHGVNRDIGLFTKRKYPRLHDTLQTISEILKSALPGLKTVKFAKLSGELGFARGFDSDNTIDPFSSNKHFDLLLNELENLKNKDFFLFLHTWMAHAPYTHSHYLEGEKIDDVQRNLIDNYRNLNKKERKEIFGKDENARGGDFPYLLRKNKLFNAGDCRALYDGGIRYVDGYMGKLLEKARELGIFDRLMIIVVSDHGEHFEEHVQHMFYDYHGHDYYEEFIKVPIIIKYPHGKSKGKRLNAPVSLIDVVPTILDYYNIKIPAHIQGDSLLIPHAKRKQKFLVSEAVTDPGIELKMIRVGNLKYIVTMKDSSKPGRADWENITERRLYDLKTDPGEKENLYKHPDFKETCLHLEKLLKTVLTHSAEPFGPSREAVVSEETLEQLRALGYIN